MGTEFQTALDWQPSERLHEFHGVHSNAALRSASMAFLAEAAEDHQPATSLTKHHIGLEPEVRPRGPVWGTGASLLLLITLGSLGSSVASGFFTPQRGAMTVSREAELCPSIEAANRAGGHAAAAAVRGGRSSHIRG